MEDKEVRNGALKSIALMMSVLCTTVVGVLFLVAASSRPLTATAALIMLAAGGASGAAGGVFTVKQEDCRSPLKVCRRGPVSARLGSLLYLTSMLLALAALVVLVTY